jgi:23S rRNA (guanosine2251-2'-O)-methyltransferase
MIIYGINPVAEALRSGAHQIERIWITRGKSSTRLQRIIELAKGQGLSVRFESSTVIRKKASTSHHQDIVAEIASVRYTDFEAILENKPKLVMLVDGVEDPHNLGALLRTAEAAGVEGICIPERRSCGVTPAVMKASAGAAIHLKICHLGNLVLALEELKRRGFWVVGLDMRGKDSPHDIDPNLPLALVVGGEHRGLRRLVREHCDFIVSLPMKGQVESLNLSVAAGVLLYQLILGTQRSRHSES